MADANLSMFVCPASFHTLQQLKASKKKNEKEDQDVLVCNYCKAEFPIKNGIPDFTYPRDLPVNDDAVRSFYDGRAESYDENLPMTFLTHGENETALRNSFIDALELKPSYKVLEIACGTGRDSEIIASRLSSSGLLCMQDISYNMISKCTRRMESVNVQKTFCLSNAGYLPFPARLFDAVYSFGAIGEFTDISKCLSEMARVARIGAKVVIGDESMPPWLRKTEFAKILIMTNKQFMADLPLQNVPVEAREFRLRYVIGGVFYLIDFRVGDGEPKGNFDFEIPGPRGGTLRTRFSGQLEGVTPETKRLAEQARSKKDLSMHTWLDKVVREAALRDLGQ